MNLTSFTAVAVLLLQGAWAYIAPATTPLAPTKRTTYDLGLGKNPPVAAAAKTLESKNISVSTAARYWMVPEAVNHYPSPKKKSIAAKVAGENKTNIRIMTGNRQAPREKSNLNTIWVDMLLQHQQERRRGRQQRSPSAS